MKTRDLILSVIIATAPVILSGCPGGCGSGGKTPPAPPPAPGPRGVVFTDVTKEAGITFVHHHGGTGERYFPETMSGGVTVFDYDGDGDLDIYFSQCGKIPVKADQPWHNVLYRNDGSWKYTDVSKESGLDDNGYSQGAVAGDYDNDGDLDLFVSNFGENHLYRNHGDGTFGNVTEAAGVGDPLWAIAASWADYDRDGFVDLYVGNYLDFTVATHKRCGKRGDVWAYCHPDEYAGVDDILYRNRGDGTFEDVTRKALPGPIDPRETRKWLSGPMEGKTMGVVWFDYDLDGWMDIYVTNDSTPNFLFRNSGDGTFTHEILAGVGYNENGRTEASMGVDAGDVNGDGYLDLFTVDLDAETNTLYLNGGDGTFTDFSIPAGLAEISTAYVGYTPNIFDFDNDGDQDIHVGNGHVIDNIEVYKAESSHAQIDFLFANDGTGKFTDIAPQAGTYFQTPTVSRSCAMGDFDDDGDLDMVIQCNNSAPHLLRNEGGTGNHSVLLDLRGTKGPRRAEGALVRITAGGKTQVDEVRTGCAYQSQGDLRVHFGLGKATTIDKVEIRWPNGETEVLENLPADQIITIEEGSGTFTGRPFLGE